MRDANGRPAAVPLRANAAGVRYSGGHEHNGNRPAGTFTPASGNSDRNGFWRTIYTSPEVGGFEEITISVAKSVPQRPGRANVTVRVPGLIDMPSGPNYRFANRFRGQPGYQVLEYNDISLIYGGLFDIRANWQPPHYEHRVGTEVDFSNADELPAGMQDGLRGIIHDNGGRILNEGNHWHVRF